MATQRFRLFISIAALLAVATATLGGVATPAGPSLPPPAGSSVLPGGVAERLAGAVRIATVSGEAPSDSDPNAFRGLHDYLRRTFPEVHARLAVETVAGASLLFSWEGRDPGLRPVLLMGHLDVVPVEAETEAQWRRPPFGGVIADGFIWGRGALDNKLAVVGILEAVELLLTQGFRPERTVYLAFGHDEETGGAGGARQIAALLEERGVTLELVLDEGGVIADGVLGGATAPVALVGIAEKGFATLELDARSPGGHASMPPRHSAVGVLGAAVARLEANPMPPRIEAPTRKLLEALAPGLSGPRRTLIHHLWLTGPLVARGLTSAPATAAMVRTTMAPTVFQAGTKDNVLPGRALALVNTRILPGDSVESVLAYARRAIDDDRVQVRLGGRFTAEPSAVSSTRSVAYERLSRAIRRRHPDATVAPYLVTVVTDARHFARLSDGIYRFLPVRLAAEDLARLHGVDERVAVAAYEDAVRTYREVLIETTAR